MKAHDLVLALLVAPILVLVSVPYWSAYDYWAESTASWIVYFLIGALFSFYAVYIYLKITRWIINEGDEEEATG